MSISNSAAFKRILGKQSLTGEDVGRLFIIELIKEYQDFKENGGDPTKTLLSDAERQALVNRLSREDFIIYLKYKDVHEYIKHLGLSFSSIQNLFTIDALQLDNQIIGTYHGERERLTQRVLHPTVVTQKQFDDIFQKCLEEKFTWQCSYEQVFFRTYEYLREQYNAGEKTPLDGIFKKWKKLPQELVELMDVVEAQHGEKYQRKGRTPKDFFDNLMRYYDSDFVNDKSFFNLMDSLPELFKAVSDVMVKALPELKKVPKSKYVSNGKASSWRKLYEMDYCGTKKHFDGFFDPDEVFAPEFKGGIAILHESFCDPAEDYIDNNGYYITPLPLFERYRVEHLLGENSEGCRRLFSSLSRYARSLFAYHELIARMSEALKVKGIEELLPPTEDTVRILTSLNHNKKLLVDNIQPFTGRNVPALKRKVMDLIPDFDVEKIKAEGIAEINKLPPLTVDFLADNIYYYSNKLLRGEEL